MQLFALALLLAVQLVSGHFELKYPYWRGDSFLPPASQYLFPCKTDKTLLLFNCRPWGTVS
jgi:hypothetical protein